ncbi:MAG: FtsQ-type POTRA domain-containing protein [Candidatus Latescibacterota bacterium]
MAAALGVVAGVGWGGRHVGARIVVSEDFGLRALEVEGLRVLTGDEVLAASGLALGDNIFAVEPHKVARRLESVPWVKKAFVRRRPPDRLVVELVERRRLAWIDVGEVLGVDAHGVLLPGAGRMASESWRDLDLPVISGLRVGPDSLQAGAAPLCPGMSVPDSAVVPLLQWWQEACAADPEFSQNVSEIRPLGAGAVSLRLVGDGLEVRLPTDRVGERLKVLRNLIQRVYCECPDPAYIDMRFAGQVVVGSKAEQKEPDESQS